MAPPSDGDTPAEQNSGLLHPRDTGRNRLLKLRNFATYDFRVAVKGDKRDVEVLECGCSFAFEIVPLHVTLQRKS